ncbi:MAG: HDOD domain-containing protein, partial [Deltaproteobacteria bacterium]|nr:HDOD domain-containing protein [Deltaproteobacteria bacterium]
LARYKKFAETDDFYTPALLHDMGKLILGKFVKEHREKIESITTNGTSLDTAEKMALGTNHAEIGALILAKWSFPSDIVDAVRWHHNPERIEISNRKSDIVYLSNLMCQSHGDSDSADGRFVMTSSTVLERLGIELDQYKLMAEKVHSYMNRLSDTLTFD